MVPADQDLNTTVTKYQLGESNPTLVVNSSDHGKQPEKDVSTIVQYAPHLLPFQTESVPFSVETATQQLYLDRGYPSFFFIRMEWDQNTTKDEGVVPRATIHSIQFRLFNQENPYVSKLTESELYYLSHSNCHKYCGFQELWENENAVLLSLEDIGLITEKLGYPHRKRLELEIRGKRIQHSNGFVT